jgi:hypothetical protein
MSRLTKIVQWIWAYVFGCTHHHTTWPQRNRAGFDHVSCLDCGKEFPYSWQQMRVVNREEMLQERNQQVTEGGRVRHVPVLVFTRKGV